MCCRLLSVNMWCRAVWKEKNQEEELVIPKTWVKEGFVHWPPVPNAKKYLDEQRQPKESWHKFKLVKLKITSDDRDECEQFNMTTTAETSSDEEGEFTCRKRKKKKKTFDGFIGSFDDISEDGLVNESVSRQKKRDPTLPTPANKLSELNNGTACQESDGQSGISAESPLPTPPVKLSVFKNTPGANCTTNVHTVRTHGTDSPNAVSPAARSRSSRSRSRDLSQSLTDIVSKSSKGTERSTSRSPSRFRSRSLSFARTESIIRDRQSSKSNQRTARSTSRSPSHARTESIIQDRQSSKSSQGTARSMSRSPSHTRTESIIRDRQSSKSSQRTARSTSRSPSRARTESIIQDRQSSKSSQGTTRSTSRSPSRARTESIIQDRQSSKSSQRTSRSMSRSPSHTRTESIIRDRQSSKSSQRTARSMSRSPSHTRTESIIRDRQSSKSSQRTARSMSRSPSHARTEPIIRDRQSSKSSQGTAMSRSRSPFHARTESIIRDRQSSKSSQRTARSMSRSPSHTRIEPIIRDRQSSKSSQRTARSTRRSPSLSMSRSPSRSVSRSPSQAKTESVIRERQAPKSGHGKARSWSRSPSRSRSRSPLHARTESIVQNRQPSKFSHGTGRSRSSPSHGRTGPMIQVRQPSKSSQGTATYSSPFLARTESIVQDRQPPKSSHGTGRSSPSHGRTGPMIQVRQSSKSSQGTAVSRNSHSRTTTEPIFQDRQSSKSSQGTARSRSRSPSRSMSRSPSYVRTESIFQDRQPLNNSQNKILQRPSSPRLVHTPPISRNNTTCTDLFPMTEAKFQRRVLYMLSDIKATVSEMGRKYEAADSIFHVRTMEGMEDFEEMEQRLSDISEKQLLTTLTFELTYNAPDGSVGSWQRGGFEPIRSDELRGVLTEEERNQLNIERRESQISAGQLSHSIEDDERESLHSTSPSKSFGSKLSISSKTSGGKSPKSSVKQISSVVKMMMLAKQRTPSGVDTDDKQSLIEEMETDISLDAKAAEVASMLSGARQDSDYDQTSEGSSVLVPSGIKRKAKSQSTEPLSLKAQDFQVCVTIIEARQLAGLNMDPVCCVQVGDQKKYTSVKESTNCPYYNEYFVFDFHMAPAMLFDKIITLTVCQSGRILRSNKPLGIYKMDVGTVYASQDHQFYHKWAMLMDPEDMSGGVKGYLKCDIAVIGKGDSVKVPPRTEKADDDDIEANLLLPDGVPADRQRANFTVKIFRAEGLPKMNTGVMASVKKALTGEGKDLVDPYVQVSFAGHKGRTSVKKGAYEPVWNEQLVFMEMFPPLCRRIKVQLRDSHKVNDDVIGTHYIDLAKIENEGEKGFMPTFGPCWINLYGSTRDYSLLDEHNHLNDGLGEGVSYRGRLLMAVRTDILDNMEGGPATVEVEPTIPLPENAGGRPDEYFLYGCFLEASMIDRKVGDKPVHFEISIGNAGNVLDGYNPPTKKQQGSSSEESSEEEGGEDTPDQTQGGGGGPKWQSTTPPLKPTTRDKIYYHMPFYEEKPCVYVKEMFEDHRRRMYNTNMLEKIGDKLEDGLAEVNEMIVQETPFPEKRLRGVFEELGSGCSKFVSLVKGTGGGAPSGKTKLDKERHKLLVREMDHMSTLARTMKATTTKSNMKDKLRIAAQYQQKIKSLLQEPQHALPDVFLWMISGNKRIAYQRLQARDIIYSIVDEERGKDCGKVKTLFLRLPGKKASSQAGWTIQAKLQIYLWLGLSKHKKDYLDGIPKGYEESRVLQNSVKPQAIPPSSIVYTEKQSFQLRAHMYQARSLIGSDASGLSDPYARIAFGDQSVCTQVIEETLSPTWDEMLIIHEVTMYGLMQEIADSPPTMVVEIFDQDKVGKSEFIGRALCKPVVKLSEEKYEGPRFPPTLEWWDIHRGPYKAGELLATFELLQLAAFGEMAGQDLPPLELPLPTDKPDRGPVMPVPKGIRPILSKHRIEVLFWGVRDLKRVQLTTVDKPRIDIECAGHVLQSATILNCKKNPNFSVPVKFFDVELPENELFCPPITIRCVDCRNFGRYVLVGTHVINSIHKFMYIPTTKKAKAALQKLFPGKNPDAPHIVTTNQSGQVSVKTTDVAVTIDENVPLIKKETQISIDLVDKKEQKTAENKKKKRRSTIDDEELDLESMDWWSKYFVSMDTLITEPVDAVDQEHEEKRDKHLGVPYDIDNQVTEIATSPGVKSPTSTPYGAIANGEPKPPSPDDPDYNPKEAKKLEDALKKMEKKEKRTLRGTAKAVSLAQKLSPKAQRKKDALMNSTAQLKEGESVGIMGYVNKAFKSDEEPTKMYAESRAVEMKIYPNELESQPEFNSFKDWLHTFELFRGKNTGTEVSDEGRIVGKFKGSLKIYKVPLPPDIEDKTVTGGDPTLGLFQGLPGNDPIKVLVRVYVVKGNDLHPADINGKADPYLVIRLGGTTLNDKENYISKQLNPVFGKCFEIEATFPMESLLTVQVYDWDLVGMDDLIGETKVDLENRYYSRHRATCGLGRKFDQLGYNAWRDPLKPTQILAKLCKEGHVDGPHYQPGKVRVANRIFTAPLDNMEEDAGHKKSTEEHLALAVLNHWEEIPKVGCKLVPEHVETRPLYNPEKPGIEQGKLEMWVDMFPMDMPAPSPPVDISPRKPKSYELRCIIWNTDDVVLEDDAFFTGEKMSDIYVKGWIKGQDDMQSTDIHYRSLTGEGNFNWRFIFPFDYLVAEEKIVISRKETLFSWDESETKIPARLNLQVWDADHFSADDFLGALTLDLNRFPRGAKNSKLCTLDMLKNDGSVPQMSLFKQKRVKGWWPFAVKNESNDEHELTGKVEAELHLLSTEDAEKHPAGQGRNEPDPLEKPNRPDSSFMWFMNPLKSLRYILWHNYKWMILKILIVVLLAALLVLFFYAMPGYTVKKIFNA